MLVNSFDTKYAKTALKYESLDNSFTKILSSNKKFLRIFTSVIVNKSLRSLSEATLRSDITGQVINTILTHDSNSKHYLYYMGDVFKKNKMNNNIKQFRQHGVEIINLPKNKSFKEVLEILDSILKNILKKNYTYVFTDPKISKNISYLLDNSSRKNNISKFVNIFKKNINAPYELNLEKDFFSQDYHQDIFFYVYSNISKKIVAQGGGYQYKKNIKKVEGFGFSCNVDYIAELI
ncbi:ATP phosphoribosyltransferase regulatory subunit [Alphaproteobacteria bacterium]|nr:ATP phosphoribosyltransferase regulatory subunit [Alphaproteobacteria bacterium]